MTESTYIYQQQQQQQQSALFSNVQQGERFQVHRIHFTGEHNIIYCDRVARRWPKIDLKFNCDKV